MDVSQIIQLLGGLGKVGTGLMSAFQKEPMPYGTEQAANALNASSVYANASLDPSSPYFKALAETEETRQRNNLISSIGEIIRQQSSKRATGAGTINPERRDEMVWGILAKGFQEAGLRAREVARQRLVEMSGAQSGIAKGFGGIGDAALKTQLINRASRSSGLAGGFEAVNTLSQLLKKKDPMASTPDDYKFGQATSQWW